VTRTERQQLAIDKWRNIRGRGTLVMPTGTGKTRTAITAIQRVLTKNPNLTIAIIVPTKVLKDQWLEQLHRIDDNLINKQINVYILNTAANHPFKCDFLIIDEIHRSNSITFRNLFLNCNPVLILGLTATYERLDGLEKQVVDHYCPVCDTITLQEAMDNNWLAPYKEYKVLLNVDLTEYEQANREFLAHFSFFDFDFNLAMSCITNPFAKQKIAKERGCDLKEVNAHAYAWKKALTFRKTFIANHPRKIEIAKEIIRYRKNKKIITFNSSVQQCESYGSGYVVHSKQSKKKNKEILEQFAKQKTGQIHSSKMLIEGLDCPGLSVAIVTGFNSSKINHVQGIGRTIRFEEGKEAEIFYLVIKGTVEDNWYAKSSEGMNYIEITENELIDVLKNKSLNNKRIKTQNKFINNLSRF
jgi:superfamily II DNA or RNA helicase